MYSEVPIRTSAQVLPRSTPEHLVRASCSLSPLHALTLLESTLTANSGFSPNPVEINPLESINDFAKSFRTHSYKIIELKVPSNQTLTKKG